MIPDLLSMIEFLCLAVSGLMAAAVTLIALRQTAGRSGGQSLSAFGARNRVSECGLQNPFGPVCAPVGDAPPSGCSNGQNTARANSHYGAAPADTDFSGTNIRVLSHPVVILQGCGRTEQCRAWFVDEALPKLTARGYEVVAA